MRTQTTANAAGLGRGGRKPRQRKRDAALRLLWSEALEPVSRALTVDQALDAVALATGGQSKRELRRSLLGRDDRGNAAAAQAASRCRDRVGLVAGKLEQTWPT